MFAVRCEDCGERTLIFPSQIDKLVNTERGIVVVYHCLGGHPGVMLTGRRAGRPAARPEARLAGAARSR